MNLRLLVHTVSHLKPEQAVFQLLNRIHTPKFKHLQSLDSLCFKHLTDPIAKPVSLSDNSFTFLNVRSHFNGWNDDSKGMLWAYNLNYMDWLEQEEINPTEGLAWIDSFIKNIDDNRIGLAPYPTALRCINWVKFLCRHQYAADSKVIDELYSQLYHLSRNIERHLLGNHILEDGFSLAIGASFFNDRNLATKAERLLRRELDRQILPDGSHFEQSPMYHSIMLDRLLDCINYLQHDIFSNGFRTYLTDKAAVMLGHLEAISWSGTEIPLFNDSAYGISPTLTELEEYASRLGINALHKELKECGYRKMKDERICAIVDIGNITASYQPGHSHADTFNYELRVDGKPFIIDTGISTYEKNARRQYERSTGAHNTVIMNGIDSSAVWGGFRVASRAKVTDIEEKASKITATHSGYGSGHLHTRSFELVKDGFRITDHISGPNTVSIIHLSPEVRILSADSQHIETERATILLEGATDVRISDDRTSAFYNMFREGKKVEISFKGTLTQTIRP